jgi:uncharacterized membrane protein
MSGGTTWISALTLAALVLGFLLRRLNALALVVASTIFIALLTFYLVQDQTLVRSILLSFAAAFTMQLGYLLGQLLQKPSE